MLWNIARASYALWGLLLVVWSALARGDVDELFWTLTVLWVVQGFALWLLFRR